MKNKKAIVILSHSSYSDIWELTITSYKNKINSSDEFDFFITTDFIDDKKKELLSHNNFSYLLYSKDITWGESFRQVGVKLNELSYEYILFSFDDLVLLNINAEKLLNVFDCMKVNNLNYVQIKNGYRSFFDNSKLNFKEKLHLVNDNDTYKGSLVFSILSNNLLNKIINISEIRNYSPWEYEIYIHKYLKGIKFYCVNKSIIKFSNVIIKGKIDRFALNKGEKNNLVIYKGNRPFFDKISLFRFKFKEIVFVLVKNIIPSSFFGYLRKYKNK